MFHVECALKTIYYTEKRYQQVGRPTEQTPFDLVWRFKAHLLEDDKVVEHIDSLFLKKPPRTMALLMVMGLSLLIYALAKHQLRTQLLEQGETLPDQTGKPSQKQTIRRVFQMMEDIDILILEQDGLRRRFLLNMTDV